MENNEIRRPPLEALSRASKLYNECCKPLCRKINLPQTALDILLFFGNNPQYNTAKDIVAVRGIQANLVSVNVEKLVQEGYLLRKPVKSDRRKTELALTDKAQPVITEGRQLQQEFLSRLFNGVSKEQMKTLSDIIEIVRLNLKGVQ